MEIQKDHLSDISFQENFGYRLASPWARFGAVFIEGIIMYLPLSLFLFDFSPFNDIDFLGFGDSLFQIALSALYGAIFYPLWSGNLGHKIFGLKVISAIDGNDQKKAQVGAIRELLKSVLGIFLIPSIWLLWDAKKQNLYDKIIKTLVVETNKSA
mgnify:CR=1 FL=1